MDLFKYTSNRLKNIQKSYPDIYDGIEFESPNGLFFSRESRPYSIAEYKAAFDMAIDHVRKVRGSTIGYILHIMRDFLNGVST